MSEEVFNQKKLHFETNGETVCVLKKVIPKEHYLEDDSTEVDYDSLYDYASFRKELLKNSEADYELFFRIMLLGDCGVGKTCILTKFKHRHFLSGNYITTVGVDFRNKIVTVEDTRIKLQIWDTAGQERFRSVTHAYYRNAHALFLLYDVTNKTSFDNIRAWLGEINDYAQDNVVIMLLGNKSDCGSNRAVKKEDGERLSREYNVFFMETSAKSGQNVDLAFMTVARQLKYKQTGEKDNINENRININEKIDQENHSKNIQCPPCNG